jgi:hypothetical protein
VAGDVENYLTLHVLAHSDPATEGGVEHRVGVRLRASRRVLLGKGRDTCPAADDEPLSFVWVKPNRFCQGSV